MSHKPPVPAGAVSPYPLRAAQSADRDEAKHELAEETVSNLKADAPPAKAADTGSSRNVRIATGAAIGSAAIAAALIFYNRSKAN